MGYVALLLLIVAIAGIFRADWRGSGTSWQVRWTASGSLAAVLLFLVLVFPVPSLNRWLWGHAPNMALQLTSVWPGGRLYLISVAFTLFGAALVLPTAYRSLHLSRAAAGAAVVVCSVWTIYQAEPFIRGGTRNRWTAEATRAAYRPSNLDLTLTSYAFLDTPQTFVHGVVDPQFEFRLLRGGTANDDQGRDDQQPERATQTRSARLHQKTSAVR